MPAKSVVEPLPRELSAPMIQRTLLLCLGSNHDQRENMGRARRMLVEVLPSLRFTQELWTKPVGVSSSHYLNCLAYGETDRNFDDVHAMTKEIERALGRTREGGQAPRVSIDIDIMQYGSEKHHLSDWDLDHMKALLAEYRLGKAPTEDLP